jgi:hypothetical protein
MVAFQSWLTFGIVFVTTMAVAAMGGLSVHGCYKIIAGHF